MRNEALMNNGVSQCVAACHPRGPGIVEVNSGSAPVPEGEWQVVLESPPEVGT
jgi:hypothetical protein